MRGVFFAVCFAYRLIPDGVYIAARVYLSPANASPAVLKTARIRLTSVEAKNVLISSDNQSAFAEAVCQTIIRMETTG